MDKNTRWMDKEVLTKFFTSMNQFFSTKNEKAVVYIFGGGALCLHDLRNKTNDFDTATMLENNNSHKYFELIKNQCLPSIGIDKNHSLFDITYNDSTSPELPSEAFPRFKEFLDKKKKEFTFEVAQEYTHLKVIVPPKEYLLINRLVDLQYANPKTQLDKLDCINLIKNLKINHNNKEEFLQPYQNNYHIEIIKTKINEMIDLSLSHENVQNNIKATREQLQMNRHTISPGLKNR